MIELIIYGAILALVALFTVNTLVTVTSAFSQARTQRQINSNAESVMERLIREIRFAQSVNASSTLNTNPSLLSLTTFVSPTDTATTTIEFSINNKNLFFKTRTGTVIQLNTSGVAIPAFIARKISNATTTAVKIELVIQASSTKMNIQKNFYGTAILRGSYQ